MRLNPGVVAEAAQNFAGGIVGRSDHILGEIKDLTGIGLDVIGIDAAGRSVHNFVYSGVEAGAEYEAVEHEVHGTSSLVQVDVTPPSMVCGQMKNDTDPFY